MTLILERFNYAPDGTFGRITLPSGRVLFTCEQPWNGNAVGASCIPEGRYRMRQRISAVVNKTSGGAHKAGWEIKDVPGRTFIMVHPANWPHELQGCISVGLNYLIIMDEQAVSKSREAFGLLMNELASQDEWEIEIRQYRPEYP